MQRLKVEELKQRDALFDFDDCLDNLSEVSERYPVIKFEEEQQFSIAQKEQQEQGDQRKSLRQEIIEDLTKQKISIEKLLVPVPRT